MYTVIVVDYNTIEKTIDYIKHCKEWLLQKEEFHVVVVDNGTRTDTVDIVNRIFGEGKKISTSLRKDVYIYEYEQCGTLLLCLAKENLGYAKGNNMGVQLADEIFCDPYYLICNNDLIIQKPIELKSVTELFEKESQIAVIGPYTEGTNGFIQNPHKFQSAFRKLILWYWSMALFRVFEKLTCDIDYQGESKICDWVTGCFMFVNATAFKKVGMFDEQTFLYGEELILSRKLEREGYNCFFCNDIRIIHNHGETVRKTVSTLANAEYSYNSLFYYYKEYEKTPRWMLKWAQINFRLYKNIFIFKQVIKKMLRKLGGIRSDY